MPYKVEQINNEPIIVITLSDPIDWEQDVLQTTALAAEIARQIEGEIYRITDLSGTLVSFSEVMRGLAIVTREQGGWNNDRIHPMVVSSEQITHDMAEMVNGQEQYGNIHIEMETSLDEAIANARHTLEQTQP